MAKSEYVRLPKRSSINSRCYKICAHWCQTPKTGRAAHIKVKGMNLVSLWGVNCRFWSQLGCLWCKVTICPSRYRLVLCIKKFTKNALTLTTEKSSLGVSLNLSHNHIGPPSGDLIWVFPRASSSLLDGSPPGCPNLCGRPRTTFTYFFRNRKMYIQSYIKYCLKTLPLPFLLVPSLWASQDTQSQINWVWDQFYPPPELTTLTWLVGLKKLIKTTFCKLVHYYWCVWICWWDLFHSFEWRRYTGLLWREGPFQQYTCKWDY